MGSRGEEKERVETHLDETRMGGVGAAVVAAALGAEMRTTAA
jgi:hypothetical protein